MEEILLPAVALLADDQPMTAEFQLAWRHATGWIAAMRRVAPPASRPAGILVFDGADGHGMDGLHAQALELVLRRGGFRTLLLDATLDATRVGRALRALEPHAIVLAGRCPSLDSLGRIVYAARQSGRHVDVYDYRGAVPDTGASTVRRLGSEPLGARRALLDEIDDRPAHQPVVIPSLELARG